MLDVALGTRESVTIFGTDWPTPDGTCLRDYIHVTDLAQAHVLALDSLRGGKETTAYNMGNGNGYSVRQVIDVARRVTGVDIKAVEGERRPGDPADMVASSAKITKGTRLSAQVPRAKDNHRNSVELAEKPSEWILRPSRQIINTVILNSIQDPSLRGVDAETSSA